MLCSTKTTWRKRLLKRAAWKKRGATASGPSRCASFHEPSSIYQLCGLRSGCIEIWMLSAGIGFLKPSLNVSGESCENWTHLPLRLTVLQSQASVYKQARSPPFWFNSLGSLLSLHVEHARHDYRVLVPFTCTSLVCIGNCDCAFMGSLEGQTVTL